MNPLPRKRRLRREESEASALLKFFDHVTWEGQIRFADVDAIGIVNYEIYLQLADEALLTWWQRLPLGYRASPGDIGVITASMSACWVEPVRDRTVVQVSLRPGRVGSSSFEVFCLMRAVDSNRPCFVGRFVHVHVRRGRLREIPSRAKSRMKSSALKDAELSELLNTLEIYVNRIPGQPKTPRVSRRKASRQT